LPSFSFHQLPMKIDSIASLAKFILSPQCNSIGVLTGAGENGSIAGSVDEHVANSNLTLFVGFCPNRRIRRQWYS
jgi:hypothetical protein